MFDHDEDRRKGAGLKLEKVIESDVDRINAMFRPGGKHADLFRIPLRMRPATTF